MDLRLTEAQNTKALARRETLYSYGLILPQQIHPKTFEP